MASSNMNIEQVADIEQIVEFEQELEEFVAETEASAETSVPPRSAVSFMIGELNTEKDRQGNPLTNKRIT